MRPMKSHCMRDRDSYIDVRNQRERNTYGLLVSIKHNCSDVVADLGMLLRAQAGVAI